MITAMMTGEEKVIQVQVIDHAYYLAVTDRGRIFRIYYGNPDEIAWREIWQPEGLMKKEGEL